MDKKIGQIWAGKQGYIYLITNILEEYPDVCRACLIENSFKWSDKYDIKIKCLDYDMWTVRTSDGPMLEKHFVEYLDTVELDTMREFLDTIFTPETKEYTKSYLETFDFLHPLRWEAVDYVDAWAAEVMRDIPVVTPDSGVLKIAGGSVTLWKDGVLTIASDHDDVSIDNGYTKIQGKSPTVTDGFWVVDIAGQKSKLIIQR